MTGSLIITSLLSHCWVRRWKNFECQSFTEHLRKLWARRSSVFFDSRGRRDHDFIFMLATIQIRENVSFSKKSAVTHFDMHNLIFGINFLSHFVSFVLITLPMMSHLIVIHLPLSHHFQHPSHIQYFIASSELTFSTDPFHRSLPAHTGLPRRTLFTGTDLSCWIASMF